MFQLENPHIWVGVQSVAPKANQPVNTPTKPTLQFSDCTLTKNYPVVCVLLSLCGSFRTRSGPIHLSDDCSFLHSLEASTVNTTFATLSQVKDIWVVFHFLAIVSRAAMNMAAQSLYSRMYSPTQRTCGVGCVGLWTYAQEWYNWVIWLAYFQLFWIFHTDFQKALPV